MPGKKWPLPGQYPNVPRWAIAIGSFGYVGFSPGAPGTVASAIAAALYYFLPPLQQNIILIMASLVLIMAGTRAAVLILTNSHEPDPGFVVLDEVAGQWIALVTPVYQGNLLFILFSFVFFRIFDIGKPFPASFFQRKRGAIHIMMDDVVAGIYANLAAHLLFWSISSIWSF